jgi:hypothetical protein
MFVLGLVATIDGAVPTLNPLGTIGYDITDLYLLESICAIPFEIIVLNASKKYRCCHHTY